MKKTPIKVKTERLCACGCGRVVKMFRTTDKYYEPACQIKHKGAPVKKPIKPIAKLSGKKKKETAEYLKKRIEYLALPENKFCFIEGCNRRATTVEHRAGRIGSNFLDTATWAPCCLQHNLELENNPELSKQYQLSKIHGGAKK